MRHPSGTPTRTLWALLGLTALALAGCAGGGPYDGLDPAGPIAEKQRDLFLLVFWIAAAVFVLVEGALVVVMIRYRQRRTDQLPKQIHGNTRLEVLWTILPALLLAGIAVPTVGTIFELSGEPANALHVTVTAHQWWWQVDYPDEKVVTANELHIPVDRPVYVTLKSKDVIHSFFVPRLAGKQDLVPGRVEHVIIQAETPGRYLGECAEYCGLSHANMKFIVIAQPADEYEAWTRDQQQPAAEPAEGSEAAEGMKVFATPLPQGTGACIACHTIDGVEGASGTFGPNLTHFGSRTILAGGILPNRPEEVTRWLHDPPAVKAGSKMPNYHLSDQQIEDLVAYLESLE